MTFKWEHGIIKLMKLEIRERGKMMKLKRVFFDLDGTLTDSMPGITRGVQYALKHYGIHVDDLRS